MSYIYLLREREFLEAGEPIYRVGTTEHPDSLSAFAGSQLILVLRAEKPRKLIKQFDGKFKRINFHQFEGDSSKMVDTIISLWRDAQCGGALFGTVRKALFGTVRKEGYDPSSTKERIDSMSLFEFHYNPACWDEEVYSDEEVLDYLLKCVACFAESDRVMVRKHVRFEPGSPELCGASPTSSSWEPLNVVNQMISYEELEAEFRGVRLKSGKTLWELFTKNRELFMYVGVDRKPYFEKDPIEDSRIINLYPGLRAPKIRPLERAAGCSRFLLLVRSLICWDNELLFDYLVNWLAFLVQNPGQSKDLKMILHFEYGAATKAFWRDLVAGGILGGEIALYEKLYGSKIPVHRVADILTVLATPKQIARAPPHPCGYVILSKINDEYLDGDVLQFGGPDHEPRVALCDEPTNAIVQSDQGERQFIRLCADPKTATNFLAHLYKTDVSGWEQLG